MESVGATPAFPRLEFELGVMRQMLFKQSCDLQDFEILEAWSDQVKANRQPLVVQAAG